MRHWQRGIARGWSLGLVGVATGQSPDVFEPPQRLTAAGGVIDCGGQWGHAGPCYEDVDGDGLRDLLVGDFGGKFQYYRNIGSEAAPQFDLGSDIAGGGRRRRSPDLLMHRIQSQLVDFDDDGILDLISGSYDPGTFHLFRGLGLGQYAAVETILDKSGKPVLTKPDQQQTFESFGSWIATVDWDHDGDLDLLLGTFAGEFRVRLNEGTRAEPEYTTDNLVVACADQPAKLPKGHATPVVVDWDGDGLWDILSGCEDGGVYWLRNVGRPGEPKFASITNLVPPHEGIGEDEWLWPGQAPRLEFVLRSTRPISIWTARSTCCWGTSVRI